MPSLNCIRDIRDIQGERLEKLGSMLGHGLADGLSHSHLTLVKNFGLIEETEHHLSRLI